MCHLRRFKTTSSLLLYSSPFFLFALSHLNVFVWFWLGFFVCWFGLMMVVGLVCLRGGDLWVFVVVCLGFFCQGINCLLG